MSSRARTVLYVFSAVVFFSVLLYGATGLRQFGAFSGAYTDMILDVATVQRHVYNIAQAVNFDIRAFDTLGEEFIFFTSITGVLFMLSTAKGPEGDHPEPTESEDRPRKTEAIRWFPTGLAAFIAALGMDLAAHGQLTPGGGFQGGAVFGSAIACVYLGVGIHAFLRVARKEIFDSLEALGAFTYAAIGVATAFAAGAFLRNVLPLGKTGALVSSGMIYMVSLVVFVEIGCGFTVLALVFIKQMKQKEESEE